MAYINIYRLDCHYGGPEEGGWWYDSGTPVVSIPLFETLYYGQTSGRVTPDTFEELMNALRAVFPEDGEYRRAVPRHDSWSVMFETEPAAAWPAERPRYE